MMMMMMMMIMSKLITMFALGDDGRDGELDEYCHVLVSVLGDGKC